MHFTTSYRNCVLMITALIAGVRINSSLWNTRLISYMISIA